MNVFGIGLPEMVLILVVALLVFGPKKLPEIGKSLGKALKGFQDASKEFENEFKRQAEMLETPQPMEATLETTPVESAPKQLHQSESEAVVEAPVEVVAETTEVVEEAAPTPPAPSSSEVAS
jgi:sec-independent protein translocase protein TatA